MYEKSYVKKIKTTEFILDFEQVASYYKWKHSVNWLYTSGDSIYKRRITRVQERNNIWL